VDQAAEPVASSDADVVVWRRDVGSVVGWLPAEGAVRPVGVVVIDVFAEDVVEMSPPGDEDPVGALAPCAGDPALADRVRPRRPYRRLDNPHVGRGEDGVERVGVLGVPVSDQELQAVGSLAEVHEGVPGLLCRPGGGRVGSDAGQVDAAVVVPGDEQHVEPAEEDGVDMEEVDCGDRLGLGGQKLFPAGGCALGAGSMPAPLRTFQMVEGAALYPRPVSSPQIRRYPQAGLSRAVSSASRRIAGPVRGRPGVRRE
jgi:hypothetical protein